MDISADDKLRQIRYDGAKTDERNKSLEEEIER
jgi:hypothetical protein